LKNDQLNNDQAKNDQVKSYLQIFIIAFLAVLALYFYQDSVKTREILEKRELEFASLAKKFRDTVARQRAAGQIPMPDKLPDSSSFVAPLEERVESSKAERSEWRSQFLMRQVLRHLALSAEESTKLAESLKTDPTLNKLATILGDHRAQEFEQKRERASTVAEEEEIQEELFRLSRKLKLAPEQERQVESALRLVRGTLKKNYELIQTQSNQAMALHSVPTEGAELRGLYDKIRTLTRETKEKEKALMLEELQGVLDDSQLNTFLAEEVRGLE